MRRVVLCSGKVYFDLLKAREDLKRDDAAIVRVERLYPFPAAELQGALARYPEEAADRLVPGGAAKHGRVAVRSRAIPGRRRRRA